MSAQQLLRRLFTRPFRTRKAPTIRTRQTPVGRRIEELEERITPVGWSSTDYLVADFSGGRIGVYNSSLAFQGYLDTSIPSVTGLDFLPNGNLVAVGRGSSQVKIYNPSGDIVSSFTDNRVGSSIDLKVGGTNSLFIGTQDSSFSVAEFSTSGTFTRSLGNKAYDGVAVLPGNVLWSGGDGQPGIIDVFDLGSSTLSSTITLDNGQTMAESMYYSPLTNTVLSTDTSTNRVYERTTSGAFVRQFTGGAAQYGVTRGAGGDVFSTSSSGSVSHWSNTGTFLGSAPLSGTTAPTNIVWAGNVQPHGWSSTDYLVADFSGGRIGVYNSSLVFQRYLDTSIPSVTGLDFLPNGNLVAVGRGSSQVKIYNPSGDIVSSFTDNRVGSSIDLKVGGTNSLFIGTQDSSFSVAEFSTSGTFTRSLGNKAYDGVAVLPGNVLWSGGDGQPGIIDVFDLGSSTLSSTITLDNGQTMAESMYYSPLTNTVLSTDTSTNRVYERTTSGAFVRQFTGGAAQYGVTRGAGGDVFSTAATNTVYHWSDTGTFLGSTPLSATTTATNIVWAGNVQIGTLSASFDGSNNLVLTDTSGKNNTMTAVVTGSGPSASLVLTDANEKFAASLPAGGVLSNGNKTLTIPLASITGSIQFNLAGGNDALTVDHSGGYINVPINYDGGAGGNDKLIVKGDKGTFNTTSATYSPSATSTPTNHVGTVRVTSGAFGANIVFSNLEPVDVTGMLTASLATVPLPGTPLAANNTLAIAEGFDTGGTIPALVVTGTTGGSPIEAVSFWNNTTVVIDTTGLGVSTDAITITSANNAHGNTNLTISTGTDVGDQIIVNGATTFAGSVSLNTVNVNSIAAGTITTGTGLSVTNTGTASTLAGIISGPATTLTKAGTGTLTLTGANTFGGGTTLGAGAGTIIATVDVVPNALGSGAVSIGGGSTVRINNTNVSGSTVTIPNTFTGTGLLQLNFAAGTTARNTTMNNVTGFNGTVRLSNSGATGDKWGTGFAAPGAAVIIDSGSQLFVTGPTTFASVNVVGAGNSENRGAIRLISSLTAPITLAGNTTIGAENGVINGNISPGVAGTTTLTVGTANSNTFANAMLNGVLSNGAGTLALNVFNQNSGATFIAGSRLNTYSGGTTLLDSSGGTRLRIDAITGTPYGSGPITIGQTAAGRAGIFFTTGGQTLTNPIIFNAALGTDRAGIRADATNITLSGPITANLAPATFSTNGTGSFNLTGKLGGPQGLVLDNAFGTTITVNLNNAAQNNDYLGDTRIAGNKGVLILGAPNQIPDGATAGNLFDYGTFNLNGNAETVNTLFGTGTVTNGSATAATLTVGAADASSAFNGVIQNGVGTTALTKIGSGTLFLAGSNTFTGATTISGGTIRLGITPVVGAVYQLDATQLGSLFQDSAGTVPVTAAGQPVGLWREAAALNNFSQPTALQQPTYQTGAIGGLPAIRFDGSAVSGEQDFLTLGTATSAQSVFIVNRPIGTLNGLDGIWGMPTDTGIRAADATNWQFTGGNANDFVTPGTGAMFINGLAGSSFGAANAPHVLAAVRNTALALPTTRLGHYFTLFGNADRSYSGDIGEILVYSTALTPSQRLLNEAYLINKWFFGATPSSNILSDLSTITIVPGATLDLFGRSETIGALDGSGTVTSSAAGAITLTTGNNNATTPFGGSIVDGSGTVALTKTGSGTFTLAGANTYTGATAVNAGALVVNGSVTSNVTVTSPGSLFGVGTITGNVSGTGTFSPGNSPGIMTINGNFTPTGTVNFEVNSTYTTAGIDYDRYIVNGTVDLSGATLTFTNAVAGAPTPFQTLTLISKTTGGATVASGSPAAGASLTTPGLTAFRIYYDGGDGNDVVLVAAVGTPTTLYVNDQFTAPSMVDGDAELAGFQTAYVGIDAFASVAAALATYPSFAGNIIVNGGTYATTNLAGGGSVTLRLVQDLANAELNVTLQSITGDANDAIATRFYNVANGNLIAESGAFAGVISGAGSVTKTATGTLTFSGNNSYTGGTVLSQGTFVHGSNLATGAVTAGITVNDAATGANATTLRFTAGVINNNSSTTYKPITVNNFGTTTTFEFNQGTAFVNATINTNKAIVYNTTVGGNQYGMMGAISGTGAGAGNTTLTFNNSGGATFYYTAGYSGSGVVANSFAGNVVIGGSINLQNLSYIANNAAYRNGVIPDAASVVVNGGATWTQGWGSESIDGLSGSGNIVLSGSGAPNDLTIGVTNGGGTYSGSISGANAVTKTGSGVQYFDGNNSYSGLTTVAGGYLVARHNNALGSTAAGTVVNTGATLQLEANGSDIAIGTEPLSIIGTGVSGNRGTLASWIGNNSYAGTITLTGDSLIHVPTNAPNNSLTLSGSIIGGFGVRKSGGNVLTYSGTASNTYSGTTILDQGTLILNKTGGAFAISGPVQMGAGNTNQPNLRMGANNQFASGVVMTAANTFNNWTRFDLLGTSQTLAGAQDTLGGLVIQNGGASTPSNVNGTLTIDNSANYSLASHIRNSDGGGGTGLLNIVKNGVGTLTFNPVPSGSYGPRTNYTGTTTINDGTLKLVDLNNTTTTAFNSPVTINSPGILEVNSSTPFATRWNYSKTLSGNGTFNKTGTGVFGISGTMSMSGQINIQNGRLYNDGVTGNWTGNTADLDIGPGAVLDLRANDISVDALTGAGEIWNSHSAGGGDVLFVGVAGGTSTYSGIIRGNASQANDNPDAAVLALTKNGAGTFTLTGASTYSGGTQVNTGTLFVNNSSGSGTGSGAVNVNSSATLGGTGAIAGAVNLNNTARLAPGTGIESLATGALTLTSGSFFDVEIGGTSGAGVPATGNDVVAVTGLVTLGNATLNPLQLSGFSVNPAVLQTFTIIDNDSTDLVIGTFAGLPEGAPLSYAGGTVYITYAGGDGNDVQLNSQPVVNGGAGNDTLVLRRASPTQNEFSLNGAAFVQVSNGVAFTFTGAGGTDLMLVDTFFGDPIPTGNVNFNGEILRVENVGGAATDTATVAPTTTPGTGTVSLAGFGTVNHTGTVEIELVQMNLVSIQPIVLNDTIGIADGSSATNGGAVPAGYSLTPVPVLLFSGNLGVTVGVRNATTTTLNTALGGDGTDAVTLNSGTGAHGVTNLNLVTGTGSDVVTFAGSSTFAGNLTANSGGTITLTAGTTTAANITLTAGTTIAESGSAILNTAGTLTTSSAGGTTLNNANTVSTFTATNTTGGNVALVSTAATLLITGIGATGGTVSVTNTGSTTIGGTGIASTGSVQVSTTANLTVSSAVNSSGGSTALLFGQGGAGNAALLNANLSGTTASVTGGAGADATTVNTTSATTLTLNGAGAGDAYTVNFGSLGGTVAIADGGASGTDSAVINGTAAADTFEMNTTAAGGASTIRLGATGQRVTYTPALEALTLDGGTGADTYNVQFANGPLPSAFTIADSGTIGTTDTANLFGTSGADSFNVNTAAAQTVALAATGEVAHYTASLEQLSVNGPPNPLEGTPQTPVTPDAGDAFIVTPDLVTVITINGGQPISGTGDTLTLNAAPLTAPIAITNPSGTPGSVALPHGRITSGSHATVFWNSIETLPVPLGLGGTFDFQPAGSPTQAGFLPVLSSDTPTSGAYAAAQVGWVQAGQGSFDRVVTFGAAGNPNSPQLQSLLRDGQWGNYGGGANNGLFQVAVAPGALPDRLVQVTVFVGDTYAGRDTMNVYVVNTANGNRTKLNPTLAALNTAGGPHQFVAYGGMIDPGAVPSAGSTKVLLRIEVEAVAGGSSVFWTIEGVDVRPLGLIAPLTLSPLAPVAVPGDGTTVDTYTGSGAAPGAELTIRPQLGTVVGVDADPAVQGFQVIASPMGTFSFMVQRPTGPGTSTITVRDVTGASATGYLDATAADPGAATPNPYLLPNPYVQPFTPPPPPVSPPATVVQAFDFNSGGSPTLAGFTPIQPGDVYTPALGKGWTSAVSGYDRGSGGTPAALFQDGAWGSGSGTFQVAVPAGSYDVRVYIGDPYTPWAGITVTAGAQTVANDPAANRYGYVTLYGVPAVGGVLSVTITGPVWVAAGLELATAGNLPAPATPAATVLSGTKRLDFNGAATDTAPGFTAATGAAYTPAAGSGWQGTVPTFERAALPVPVGLTAAQWQLYRDAAYGGPAQGRFQFAVPAGPGTSFAARVYVGDSYNNWPGISLQMEGGALVNANTSANPFWSYLLSGSDVNGDGVVTITVSGQVWVVNGIDLVPGTTAALPASAGPGAAPQLAAEGAVSDSAVSLTAAELAPIAAEAVRRWEAAGLSASQRALLQTVTFAIGDLGRGGALGLTSVGGNVVRLDDDGAGRGWFVDATPSDDVEYASAFGLTELSATDRSAARGYDLLTVVMHELGHTLGLDSVEASVTPHDLLTATLPLGTRRLPTPADAPVKLLLADEVRVSAGTWDAPVSRSAAPPQAASRLDAPMATVDLAALSRATPPAATDADADAWTLGGIAVG